MAATKSKTEWHLGTGHEELLEATRLLRRHRAQLQRHSAAASKPLLEKTPKGTAGKGKVPTHEAVARVRDLLEDNFDDLYDAFTELDGSNKGRLTKMELKDGLRAIGATSTQLPDAAIEELFEAIDIDQRGFMSLKQFLLAFQKIDFTKHKNLKRGGLLGERDLLTRKIGTAPWEDREAKIKRDFDEVLMECKDDRGVQKYFAMPAQSGFSEILQRLQAKYGRPVTFVYEAEGHQFTVKNAKDLRKCWDYVELQYHKSGSTQRTAHLDAFVVDYDASKHEATTTETRVTLAVPLKTKKQGEKESALSKLRRGMSSRDPVASIDFTNKHKWIDDMMKALGAPTEGEPPTMQGRWDILLTECRQIDNYKTATVTMEGFRNALTRTEPRMSVDQIEWFVRDAEKTEAGDVLYEKYINAKKTGVLGEGNLAQDSAVGAAEIKINAAMRQNFKSLQQAFRRMDLDRDGRLSREEFKKGIEQRLKLKLAPRLLDAVAKRADFDGDGFIDYEDFLERFRGEQATDEGVSDDLTDMEISRLLLEHHAGSVARAFDDMDSDKDGRVSAEELYMGLQRARIFLSRLRADKFMETMDVDQNRFLDYREFLKHMSKVDLSMIAKGKFDAVARDIRSTCERMREKFDDSKQAFYAFDKDRDGRLSWQEFLEGIGKFFDAGSSGGGGSDDDADHRRELIYKMFERTDRSGDGFVAYHEFMQTFVVKPKHGQGASADKDVRDFLRTKFPGNITAAFQALDLDEDNILSKSDLLEGLQRLGMQIDERKVEALVRRGDDDEDENIDYLEFLVRFGLETKAEGKWEYKAPEAKTLTEKEIEAAKPFKTKVQGSKWYGRGGVIKILRRFDGDKDGKLNRKEFEAGLKDGIGMMEITSEEIDKVVGKFDKPYCDAKKSAIDIVQFMQMFIDVHCTKEMAVYHALLVRNTWLDLLHEFKSFGSAGSQEAPLISKADFSIALQRLVDKGMMESAERTAIITKTVEDGRYEKTGRYVGYIDYLNNFLRYYIAEEMTIYEVVSPLWEDWARKLDKAGGTLTYAEFREVCSSMAMGTPLTSSQIEFLIDVIDADGDGTVTRTELVRRYARDDALLMVAIKNHWLALMKMMNDARRPGNTSKTLPRQDMQATLVKACEANLMGDVGKEHVPEIISRIVEPLVNESGQIKYEDWIRRYAGTYCAVHYAFQGDKMQGFRPCLWLDSARSSAEASGFALQEFKLPVWNAVISLFEMVDATKGAAGERHEVSWDHFRKVLTRAGVELDNVQIMRLIEHLDPSMSGTINWVNFVRGVGDDGDLQSAPYFFNGDLDMQMRALLTRQWDDFLGACKRGEADVRKSKPALIPADLKEVVPLETLTKCIKERDKLKLGDTMRDGKAKEHPLVKKITDVAKTAFGQRQGVALVDADKKVLVDYAAMARYYAGDAYDAESLFERKWESVVDVLKQLDVAKDGSIPRDVIEKKLLAAELGLSDSMVQFLLKDQSVGSVDYQEMCWRCGRSTIVKILASKWSVLMKEWRLADKSASQRLDAEAFRAVLDRADIGLSNLQVDMLIRHVDKEEDGRLDYHKVLSGKLRGSSYSADVYLGWRALEASWESIAENFEQLDSNSDGVVSHAEFKANVLQMRINGLTDAKVIDALLKELDPSNSGCILFEDVTWALSKEKLKENVGAMASEIVVEFRNKAANLFAKHSGMVPEAEMEKLLDTLVNKKYKVKKLYLRLVAHMCAKDAMVSEAGLYKILNELSGGSLGKADASRLRDDFAFLLDCSKLDLPEAWREKGEEKTAPKTIGGMCVHSTEEPSCIGKNPHTRQHMHYFLKDDGVNALPSMRATPALEAIHKARVAKVYSSAPWKSFWETRSEYVSPMTVEIVRPAAIAQGTYGYAPKKFTRMEVKRGEEAANKITRVKTPLEIAEAKLKKYLIESRVDVMEALKQLDVEGTGAATTEAMHAWLVNSLQGINEEQTKALVHELDPHSDGLVLFHQMMNKYGPPQTDLARIAEERHKRGVYTRLRDRVPPPQGSGTLMNTPLQQQQIYQHAQPENIGVPYTGYTGVPIPVQNGMPYQAGYGYDEGGGYEERGAYGRPVLDARAVQQQQRLMEDVQGLGHALGGSGAGGELAPLYQETVEQLRQLFIR